MIGLEQVAQLKTKIVNRIGATTPRLPQEQYARLEGISRITKR